MLFLKVLNNLFQYIVSGITAPIMYPVWWKYRFEIDNKIDVAYTNSLRKTNPELVKDYIISKSNLWFYWLWLYGEHNYRTGDMSRKWLLMNVGYTIVQIKNMSEEEQDKLCQPLYSNFWYRYRWSALRNPRYNYNHLYYISGVIRSVNVIRDTRTQESIPMVGFGDVRIGTYYAKFIDENNKNYFIYEYTTKKYHFSFGWSGLMSNPIGKRGTFGTTIRFVKY